MAFCTVLNYPLLVARMIFEDLDPGQVFELSRLSKRMEQKIKDAGVRCQKHFVSFTGQPSICLNFSDQKRLEILFNMPLPKNVKLRSGHFKDFRFNYAIVSESKMIVYPEHTTVFSCLYQFYDNIAGIFQTKMIGQLDVDVDKIKNLIGLFSIPEFAQCETLQLFGEKMEEEDAQYIQDNCQIDDTLVLRGQVGRRDQHWKMFEVKNLIVKSNDWLNLNDLFLMQCQNIYIVGSQISDMDLIEFVKSWKEGQANIRLKTLCVEFLGDSVFPKFKPRPLPPFPERVLNRELVEEIFQENDWEIDAREQNTPWKELNRRLMNFEKHMDSYNTGERNFSKLCEEPDNYDLDCFYRDVEKFDGTLASISIRNNTFRMIVWHEFELPPI